LVFNSPTLNGGAIDMRDIHGFSHIPLIFDAFLDQSHYYKSQNPTPPQPNFQTKKKPQRSPWFFNNPKY